MKRHEFVVLIQWVAMLGVSGVLYAQSVSHTVLPTNLTVHLGEGVRMEFVLIRPGTFQMGSSKDDPETPLHPVTISKPYYIGKYEVTQEQWQAVMGKNPSYFKGEKHPVEMVGWDECQAFLQKLRQKVKGYHFRLPTEAEWEYACRAGSQAAYCFGDDVRRLSEYAWFNGNSRGTTHPVGTKKPNAWGLHDMHGNVWEWCQDWYGNPDTMPVTDPTGPRSGARRMLRGGSWLYSAKECRSFVRDVFTPSMRLINVGLRVVIGLDQAAQFGSDD